MIPVSFYTLGCKLNQNETEALSASFNEEGFTIVPWNFPADDAMPLLCIINTCTVTSKAEQKARRIIRLSLNAGCVVLVTGCYAQLEQDVLKKLGKEKKTAGPLFIFPGQGKEKLLDLPRYLADTVNIFGKEDPPAIIAQLTSAIINFNSKFFLTGAANNCARNIEGVDEIKQNGTGPIRQTLEKNNEGPQKHKITGIPNTHQILRASVCLQTMSPYDENRNAFSFNPQHFSFHSRAFLKIQDGCNLSCAYCRVPLARGKSISLEPQEALLRLQALEDKGVAEAVLTGVNICQYHGGKNPSLGLPGLLKFLLENTRNISLRLSSIEPVADSNSLRITNGNTGISDDFFEILANKRIRNHFHLSVQSGSDSVLAKMGRAYKARDIVRIVEKLRTIRDDPFIACDIITGFPGETGDDFEKTAGLCKSMDFAWIHGFPYSKRPGTSAAAIKENLVSEKTAKERLQVLLEYAKNGKKEYIHRWQGKVVEAVAESPGDEPVQPGEKDIFFPFFPAMTDNYIKVRCVSDSLDGFFKEIKPGIAITCKIGKTASEYGFDAWAVLEK